MNDNGELFEYVQGYLRLSRSQNSKLNWPYHLNKVGKVVEILKDRRDDQAAKVELH